MDGVTANVRPTLYVSETAGPIVFKFGAWLPLKDRDP